MTTAPSDLDAEGWRDWRDVAATDLADPDYFVALVRAIDADQEPWATE